MIRIFLALVFAVAPFAAATAENPAHLVSLRQTMACAGCDLSGAHLRVARIAGANLAGADLSGAIGLTQAQIRLACGNAGTRLPAGLSVKPCLEG